MSEFFMTYGRSRPKTLVPWIEHHDVPILSNVTRRWSDNTERLLPMWDFDTKHVVDAGGYNVQSRFATDGGSLKVSPQAIQNELQTDAPFYPWTVVEYHEWLSEYADRFTWACAMDYACEERFDALWDVESRMDATIDNTIEHFEQDPDYAVLPVLQGRCVDDYVESYERLTDHGIPCDRVGLGTICRISSQNEIVETEREVRNRTGVESIHGFGVKVSAYKLGATFETADSAAWVSEAKNGRVYNISRTEDGGLRLDGEEMKRPNHRSADSRRRTIHSFQTYYAYVTWLMEGEPAIDVDVLIARQEMDTDEYLEHVDHLYVDNSPSELSCSEHPSEVTA